MKVILRIQKAYIKEHNCQIRKCQIVIIISTKKDIVESDNSSESNIRNNNKTVLKDIYGNHGAYAPDIHKKEKDLEIEKRKQINQLRELEKNQKRFIER